MPRKFTHPSELFLGNQNNFLIYFRIDCCIECDSTIITSIFRANEQIRSVIYFLILQIIVPTFH